MRSPTLALIMAGLACCAAPAAQAQSAWDAVGDFQTYSNLEAPWSYRWRDAAGQLRLMNYSNQNCSNTPGLACWNLQSDGNGLPLIGQNTTGAPIDFPSGVVPLSVLHMHPGPGGERPVLTYTVPFTGWYRVTGQFQMVDRTPTGVQVLVTHAGTTLLDKSLTLFGDTATFNWKRRLYAGQEINFSVDAAGDYANDSTMLKAAVLRLN
jgi:hypothetical protein